MMDRPDEVKGVNQMAVSMLSSLIEAERDLTERRSGIERRSGYDRRSGDRRGGASGQTPTPVEEPPPTIAFRGTVEPSRAVELLCAAGSALEFVTPWQLEKAER